MKAVKCKIKGHAIIPVKTANVQIKEYKCSSCKQKFTVDGYGKLVKLTQMWQQTNRLFEHYFKHRTAAV